LTLAEALLEFQRINSELIDDRGMSDDSRTFFRRHDIAHIVFLCDVSLLNEAMAKTWTAFGTTLGFWKHIAAYSRPETTEIVRDINTWDIAVTFLRSLVLMPRVMMRCRAMSRRWPWAEHEDFLDRRLVDIRREFNIKPIVVA
jgi:hypothetical protein